MTMIKEIILNERDLSITWSDDSQSNYHYLWLRDNCSTGFHPQTEERIFSLLSVSPDLKALTAEVSENGQSLEVNWSEGNHQSTYALDWLKTNDYSQGDQRQYDEISWDKAYEKQIAIHDYQAVMAGDDGLCAWMDDLAKYGLTVVKNMPDSPEATTEVARRIGHLRESNFGVTFNVKSKPNPNNAAYTADALPLHTDLPNQETPPGYQFLHCLQNESQGGESTYADGFKVAEYLREHEPRAFKLLSTVNIPFRFHDTTHDMLEHRPVISVIDGRIDEIKYNAHLATTFDMPPAVMYDYYVAYRTFMAALHRPEFMISYRMSGGDMVVFDNRRVLHGRKSFDPNTGARHLHGCYVDRTEFKSKRRLLARKNAASA